MTQKTATLNAIETAPMVSGVLEVISALVVLEISVLVLMEELEVLTRKDEVLENDDEGVGVVLTAKDVYGNGNTIEYVRQTFDMFPLTLEGLGEGVSHLLKGGKGH